MYGSLKKENSITELTLISICLLCLLCLSMGGNQTWVENREMQLDQLLFIHNLLSLWENCAYGFLGNL